MVCERCSGAVSATVNGQPLPAPQGTPPSNSKKSLSVRVTEITYTPIPPLPHPLRSRPSAQKRYVGSGRYPPSTVWPRNRGDHQPPLVFGRNRSFADAPLPRDNTEDLYINPLNSLWKDVDRAGGNGCDGISQWDAWWVNDSFNRSS